jgi:hypothetical protein
MPQAVIEQQGINDEKYLSIYAKLGNRLQKINMADLDVYGKKYRLSFPPRVTFYIPVGGITIRFQMKF